jgi:hypothetical protein
MGVHVLGAAYTDVFPSDSLSDFMQIGWSYDSLSDMKIEHLHGQFCCTLSDLPSDSMLMPCCKPENLFPEIWSLPEIFYLLHFLRTRG